MPSQNVRLKNFDILNAYLQGSQYTDRIPELTRDNIAEVGNAIMNYSPAKNEFVDALVNLIGLQFVSGFNYSDKFAKFKGEPITYGDTIEDIYVDAVPAEAYNQDDENPFSQKRADGSSTKPNLAVLFHKIDRELVYTVTINDNRLRRAFRNEGGLDSLIQAVFTTLQGSKELDEYIGVKEMLRYNYDNANYEYPASSGTKPAIIEIVGDELFEYNALKEIKRLSNDITFASRAYNKLHVMTFTPKENQVLVLQKDVKLNIEMQVLAGRPNLENLELGITTETVDDFNANEHNIFAVLLDERGLRIHDALNTQETQRNGKALYTNYFLHLWQLISWAYFRNAIYFVRTTAPETLSSLPMGYEAPKGNSGDAVQTEDENVQIVKASTTNKK